MNIPETRFSLRLQQREEKAGLRDSDLVQLNRSELYSRLKAVIGNNPFREMELSNGNTLIQIDETCGPSESHYDRVFIPLLESLEMDGKIDVGAEILETSTGSAGISFAWTARKLGFHPHIFMPSYVPEPRILETQRFAGYDRVTLVDDRQEYIKACSDAMVRHFKMKKANAVPGGRKIWMANHSQDLRTPSFFAPIVDESRAFLGGSDVDYFIGGIGNGSTLLGIGERLKQFSPDAKVIGFEPHRAATYFQRERSRWGNFAAPLLGEGESVYCDWSFHDLPGTGASGNVRMPFIETAIERGIMDDVVPVDERCILSTVRYNDDLPLEKKLGHSSLVARALAERMALDVSGKVFLTLAYDRDDRYGKPQYV